VAHKMPSMLFIETPTFTRMVAILLSNDEYSEMRVSVKALQDWEQHRRTPTGPAATLLKIVSSAPEVAIRSLHGYHHS